MRHSERLSRIPPYLFAELERKIAAKRAAGVDVISLGIGDPDRPTPALIVEAMQEAVAEPETHHYPSNRGRVDFREAIADFYARRFDVQLDPETEVMPAIGAKECIFNLNLAFLDPGEVALAADPGYPVYTGGPAARRRRGRRDAARARARLRPGPRRDRAERSAARQADVRQLPQQPDRRRRPARLLRARRRVRPRPTRSSSSTTTPTRRPSTTATSPPRSSRPRAPRRSASRSSRSPRATT